MNERLSICYSLTEEVIIMCLRYAVNLHAGATFTLTYFSDFGHSLRCKAYFRYFGMLRNIDW
jgi:hypothetical protein